MFNRANKVTSLLMAVAAVVSLMPSAASASSSDKIKAEKGTVYSAEAYKDGKFYISGKFKDKDEDAYYLNDGKYTKLKDLDSEDNIEAYGDKYIKIDDGDHYVDLSNGDVSDKDLKSKDTGNVGVELRSKIKADNDGRYDTDDAKEIKDVTEIPKAKFADDWYLAQYKVKTVSDDVNGGESTLNVYTNKDGKYIDADYSIGKVKVKLSSGKTVTLENTNDKEDNVRAKVSDAKTIGQDSNNIYRLATITVKSLNNSITIKEVNGVELNDNTKAYTTTDKLSVSFRVIQVISKSQDSKKVDGIRYSKNVTSYALSEQDGKEISLLNDDEKAFTVSNGKLINYKVDGDELEAKALDLKYKSSTYYTDIKGHDSVKIQDGERSVDVDSDGNLWALSDDNIYKFDNNENFDKVYETDKEYSNISVYDKNNLIVWNGDDEIYSIVGGKSQTSSDTNSNDVTTGVNTGNNTNSTTTNTNTGTNTTTGTAAASGWTQDANGDWNYIDADGSKHAGWLGGNGSPWYYFYSNGVMATGWQTINGKWYMLNPVSDGTKGVMKTGWYNDNGTWYYLDPISGAMASDTVISGWKLNSSGAWVK